MNDKTKAPPPQGGTRSSGSPPPPSRYQSLRALIKHDWKTQIVLILLAVFIWWAVKRGAEDTQIINNLARLEVIFDEKGPDLAKQFQFIRLDVDNPPSLRVTGPQKEINRFRELLDQRDKGAIYRLRLKTSDIESLKPDANHQLIYPVRLERFDESLLPTLREVSVEFSRPDDMIDVVLEERVKIKAGFDAQRSVLVPQAYSVKAEVKTDVFLRGAWSRVKAYDVSRRGHKQLNLANKNLGPEIAEALRDKTADEKRHYLSTPINLKLGIQPVEGFDFLDSEDQPLDAVSIVVTLEEKLGFVLETREIPITVLLPYWMAEKKVEINPLDRVNTLEVGLLVDPAKRANFTNENVRLILDLHHLEESIGQAPEDNPNSRVATLKVSLRLDVSREKLPYRIPTTSSATEENFYDYHLTIVWTEQ